MPISAEAAVEQAIKNGVITKLQIQGAIARLVCFSEGYLVSGGDDRSVCNRARLAYNCSATNVNSIFPSGIGEIPAVCKECPVFAPALIALIRLVPQ